MGTDETIIINQPSVNFETHDITLDFTEKDFNSIAYDDITAELAEYGDYDGNTFVPLDRDGNCLYGAWYTFTEGGQLYYEYSADGFVYYDGYACRTRITDPRQSTDFGTLRIMMDMVDASVSDLRSCCATDEYFIVHLKNYDTCYAYDLYFTSDDIQRTKEIGGRHYYVDVLLPSGEYSVELKEAPVQSYKLYSTATTLVRSDRDATCTIALCDVQVKAGWHRVENGLHIGLPAVVLIAAAALLFRHLGGGAR
jgi:hypothetical protein